MNPSDVAASPRPGRSVRLLHCPGRAIRTSARRNQHRKLVSKSWRPIISNAMAWARQRFPFREVSCVAIRPWGRVLALHGSDGTAFLKCISKDRRREVEITRFVSRIAENTAGEVIDVDVRNGYLLMTGNHPGSREIDMTELMERYAMIQLNSQDNSDTCGILPVRRPLEQLAEFREAGVRMAVTSIRGAIARRRYARIAQKISGSAAIRRHLGNGVALLEHGDLHPGNVVVDLANNLRIIDWADASWAPVGSSLPFLPLSPHILAQSLRNCGTTKYIDRYVDLLSDGLNIDRSRISEIMIAGSISGVVSVANEMASSNWQTHRNRRFAKKLLIACYETAASLARNLGRGR